MHFMEALVGPQCAQLAVDRPEQYGFDPGQLLVSIAAFMLRLAERQEFVEVCVGGGGGGWLGGGGGGCCACCGGEPEGTQSSRDLPHTQQALGRAKFVHGR